MCTCKVTPCVGGDYTDVDEETYIEDGGGGTDGSQNEKGGSFDVSL